MFGEKLIALYYIYHIQYDYYYGVAQLFPCVVVVVVVVVVRQAYILGLGLHFNFEFLKASQYFFLKSKFNT